MNLNQFDEEILIDILEHNAYKISYGKNWLQVFDQNRNSYFGKPITLKSNIGVYIPTLKNDQVQIYIGSVISNIRVEKKKL